MIICLCQVILFGFSCMRNPQSDPWNQSIVLPTGNAGDYFHAVIENPAGESFQFFYDPVTETLDTLSESGVPIPLSFLPYPVNTGFIPATDSNSGEFTRIEVFVLARRLDFGKSYLVSPIALMSFYEFGISREIVLAVPFDEKYKLIPATSFQHLLFEYDPLKFELQHWITFRKGLGSVQAFRWSDEVVARAFLQRNF